MLRLAFTSLSKCSDMRRFVLAIPMVGPDCRPALQTMLRSWTHLSSFTWDGNAPESGKAIMLSHLASAPDLSQLWLVKLNITDNDLSKDQVLRRILSKEKLSHVILAGNNIRALPIEAVLSSTPNLRYFHLDYNYGLVFPPKLMSPYDIPGFFEELRSGCCAASSMNLFIVGDGATGKTTLKVKALLGQDPLPAGTSMMSTFLRLYGCQVVYSVRWFTVLLFAWCWIRVSCVSASAQTSRSGEEERCAYGWSRAGLPRKSVKLPMLRSMWTAL